MAGASVIEEQMRVATDPAIPAIEFDQLTKRFGEHAAVDNMTFTVPRGSIFGFLGPNGAGKTTTIGMAVGLIPPTAGTARVLGFDVATQLPEVLRHVGAMVERPAFYPFLSGRMNLQIFAKQAGLDDKVRVDEVIEMVGMSERADAKFGGYSTGMKQRIGIASALLDDPDVTILDEPTSGLDPAGQREIRALVRRLADAGHTVFLSSHILGEIQDVCTHVAIINRGKLVATGQMHEILETSNELVIDVDRPEEARSELTQMVAADDVHLENGRLIVQTPLEQAAEINMRLVQAGFAVSQLRHREKDLEDRFLELTEQHTRSELNNG